MVCVWGNFLWETHKKPYRTLKHVLFDIQKKVKSSLQDDSNFLNLHCVVVSRIIMHNRIEKMDEAPFLYFIPKIVRTYHK